MRILWGLLSLLSSAARNTVNAADVVAFRDLAPPSFHTGSVFHGFSDTPNELDFRRLNLREFDGMSASIYMAYGPWDAPNSTIYTAPWERVVDLLTANNKVIHGHVLVYPNTHFDLDWWQEQPDSLVQSRMYKYIDKVAGARRGKVWIWDVVNEVMGDDGNTMDADGVRTVYRDGRPIKEYKAMGQSYVAKAFRRAHAADSSALLLIADYSCEEDDPTNTDEKSDRLFRFVQKLKRQKVPVHGVGIQMHVSSIPGEEPNYTRIALNFERFRNAKIPIFITEMDVSSYKATTHLNMSSSALQQAANRQALVYARVMKICLNEPACKCLLMWDDAEFNSRKPNVKYSWLHPYDDGRSTPFYYYPSPFWDINPRKFSPKPAWYAMRRALVNYTGVYRLTSLWEPGTSFLNRYGNSTTAFYQVGLASLNSKSTSWMSMKWRFERASVGLYRIACTWFHSTGYLTRLGIPDDNDQYYPGSDVYVQDLHEDWLSQLWQLEYLHDNQYKITSAWGDDGTLTRLGEKDQDGVWQPTSTVYLDANNSWSSQIWRLERVWSSGDTKTASSQFWL